MKLSLLIPLLLIMGTACSSNDGTSTTVPPSEDATNSRPDADAGNRLAGDASPPNSSDAATADAGPMGRSDAAPMPRADNCVGLCEYLEMCGSCFYDPQGECLDVAGCAAVCDRDTAPAVAACIAQLGACDNGAFQGCYDANIGDDACAQTCRFLENCGECFTDDSGECLSLAACAAVCRENTPPAAASCIATLSECSGISGCYD